MTHHDDADDLTMETPDTAPSRGRVIGLAIIGYAIVACAVYFFLYQFAVPTPAAAPADTAAPLAAASAVYLAPVNDNLVTAAELTLANIQRTTETSELAVVLGNNPNITVIYLHPEAVAAADSAFLRQQFGLGKLIVALNTPLSTLAQKLGVKATQPDLPVSEDNNDITIAVLKARPNGGPLELTAAYRQFGQIPLVVNGLR